MNKDQQLNKLFDLARNEETVHSFEATKALFIQSIPAIETIPSSKKNQLFTLKNGMMIVTISTILLAVFMLSSKEEQLPVATKSVKSSNTEKSTNDSASMLTESKIVSPNQNESKSEDLVNDRVLMNAFSTETPSDLSHPSTPTSPFNWSSPKSDDEPYRFPILTEKEIAQTVKKKKAMLKALQKYDKNVYAYVPSGTFQYDTISVSVQAFYMSKTEVTNLEYRTFLFDLLLQDRKDEFLKAKPDQKGWSENNMPGGKPFEEHYFSHEAYNDYPMVNVSKDGAELYCLWLTTELRKFVGEKKEGNYNDVRLPQRVEWVKAASAEGKQLPYPWNGQFVRNRTGMFQANFTRALDDTLTGFQLEKKCAGHDLTAPVKSFWPNELDLYNMSGNVAEMVYDDEKHNVVGTAGGSWRSNSDEIKIYAPDPNPDLKGSAPDIGFRIVTTFLK